MKCNDYREILTNLIDNELTTQNKKEALEHEAGCPECHDLRTDIQSIVGKIKGFEKVKASAGFESTLANRIHEIPMESLGNKLNELFNPSSYGFKTLAAGFAVVALMVTGSFFMYGDSSTDNVDGLPALSSPSYIEKSIDDSQDEIKSEESEVIDDKNAIDSEEKDKSVEGKTVEN